MDKGLCGSVASLPTSQRLIGVLAELGRDFNSKADEFESLELNLRLDHQQVNWLEVLDGRLVAEGIHAVPSGSRIPVVDCDIRDAEDVMHRHHLDVQPWDDWYDVCRWFFRQWIADRISLLLEWVAKLAADRDAGAWEAYEVLKKGHPLAKAADFLELHANLPRDEVIDAARRLASGDNTLAARSERTGERYVDYREHDVILSKEHPESTPIGMLCRRNADTILDGRENLRTIFDCLVPVELHLPDLTHLKDKFLHCDQMGVTADLRAHLEILNPTESEPRATSPEAAPPIDRESQAIALLFGEKHMTMTAIADAVGCSRQTLYDMPKFCKAAVLAERMKPRGDTSGLRRGHKDKDGTVEAYVDVEDE